MKKDELRARLLATFRGEAEEHLQAITKNLLALEAGMASGDSGPLVEDTFRGIGLQPKSGLALTGVRADAAGKAGDGPTFDLRWQHFYVERPTCVC